VPGGGAHWNRTSGPSVGSSGLGPNVPAWIGPAISSQNGWNVAPVARAGSKWWAAA